LAVYCIGSFLSPLIGSMVAANDSVMRRSWGSLLVYFGFSLAEVSAIVFLAALCRRFQRILLVGSAMALLLSIGGIYGFHFQSPFAQTIAVEYTFILVLALDLLAAWGLFLERKPGSVAIAAALVVVQGLACGRIISPTRCT